MIVGLAGVTAIEVSVAARTGAAASNRVVNNARNGSSAVVRYLVVELNVLQIY